MNTKAILFGGTGMVGEGVLHEALHDAAVQSILVIGRRSCNMKHRKLNELLHNDFYDYTTIEDRLRGYNACFFCLGVTSVGKQEEEYRRLTYDLTISAARTLSRLNPDMTFCYVSGAGTDGTEQGRSMWARVKGKTENDLMKFPFKAVYAFRPGFIKPTPGLKNSLAFSKALAPLYPVLKLLFPKYVCTLEDVGRAMIHAAEGGYPKRILECRDITQLSREKAGAIT
ncbi:MAG: epimerase [Ignavibacteriales bacterium]|nr:epimerase [Ignavibacteriales bacterium]